MASSFAAYASQYLSRQQKDVSTVSSSSQLPMFYSFTTDGGSRAGGLHDRDLEVNDEGDPHIGRNGSSSEASEDDPYLRLDEDDQPSRATRRQGAREGQHGSPEEMSDDESAQGWLAHQTGLPHTKAQSLSDLPDQSVRDDEAHLSLSNPRLTESLLPRDGHTRPADIFSLPDPRRYPINKRMYKDGIWTKIWGCSVCACFIGSFLILFTVSKPTSPPRGAILPYTTLLHTIPLITILTVVSAFLSYLHILLLRIFVQPVLYATAMFIPVALMVSALWAFIGSFMWNDGVEPSWGETVGLRLFSLIPLFLAVITARQLPDKYQNIHKTSALLDVATRLLMNQPFLLALSPFILLLSLLTSIPFITLTLRLLLVGYFDFPLSKGSALEWHLREWAGWAIIGTLSVWLWSWGVSRGVLRTTCSGVVGAWYFTPNHLQQPPPLSTHRIHAALFRAASLNLGSIALSSLLMTGIRIITFALAVLCRAPSPVLYWLSLPISMLTNLSTSLSSFALVYTGLTGDAFLPSARRARALTSAGDQGNNFYRVDPSLSILTITPLTMTLPFALTTYLFVAHTLLAPEYAPGAALLAGTVTALVGVFCVALIKDTADTLYLCHCIDTDVGQMHQQEIYEIFGGTSSSLRQHFNGDAAPSRTITNAHRNGAVVSDIIIPAAEMKPASTAPYADAYEPDCNQRNELYTDYREEGMESDILPGSDLF